MPQAESYGPKSSRLTRLARAQQSMTPGSLEGRFRQAAPVPDSEYREPAEPGLTLYIGPDDPGLGNYDLWFDTDEPV